MVQHSPEIRSNTRSLPNRTEQLRQISDQLETVLESLDLETETQLADEVIVALRAMDRAYELESTSTMERSDVGMFQFDSTAIQY